MGYTTDFEGRFKLNKPLDADTCVYLKRFSETRRMKFDPKVVGKEYGIDGEFYVGHHTDFTDCFMGQVDRDFPGLVEYNSHPVTQPALWCQWIPSPDGEYIEWDGCEKFYGYVDWLKYIIKNFLAPKGYELNGEVKFQGEDYDDRGVIVVKNNVVEVINDIDELTRLRKENEDLKSKLADKTLLED